MHFHIDIFSAKETAGQNCNIQPTNNKILSFSFLLFNQNKPEFVVLFFSSNFYILPSIKLLLLCLI